MRGTIDRGRETEDPGTAVELARYDKPQLLVRRLTL